MDVMHWWPVIAMVAGVIVWGARLEGRLNQEHAERIAVSDGLDKQLELYATSKELSEVRGQVLVAISQLADLKPMLTRIEGKVDAFLIASVQHGDGKALR